MRYLDGHNAYEFADKAGDGYLLAAATIKGVQLSLRGYSRTRNSYILFSMPVEETADLSRLSDELSDLVPSVEAARAEHDREQQERAARYAREFPGDEPLVARPYVALAPVVCELETVNHKRTLFKGVTGGLVEPPNPGEELETLGEVIWAPDQLIVQFNEVDVLLFRPEVFRSLGQIAANQPELPPATSFWDNIGQ